MLLNFSLYFLLKLIPHLLCILVPSFLMQFVINMPCSYLRVMDNFTGLIEFIPGVVWSLFYTFDAQNGLLEFRQLLTTLCVVLWSFQLGGFLVYRMMLLESTDTRIDDLSEKYGRLVIVAFWLGPHAFWSVICCLPVALIHALSTEDVPLNLLDAAGLGLWMCGFTMELVANTIKLKAKLSRRKKYYHLGSMWTYSRNPNHCGEVFCWLGISIVALNLFFYHPVYQYNIFILILTQSSPLFTLLVMAFEAVLTSETSNNKRFGSQLDYRQYRKQTSVLWPAFPYVYLRLPKWIRKTMFFELKMYDKGLKNVDK